MTRQWLETGCAVLLAAIAAMTFAQVVAHQRNVQLQRRHDNAAALVSGDPATGRRAIVEHGCGACHEIPGIAGAHGRVGPPLDRIASRVFVAGIEANTADNLVNWIQHPRQMDPKTAMPDLGLDERTARDIAAYLYAAH